MVLMLNESGSLSGKINGIVPVKFPRDGKFGSGDIPLPIPKLMNFSTYTGGGDYINQKDYYEDEPETEETDEIEDFEELEEDFVFEKGSLDAMRSSNKNRDKLQKKNAYLKKLRDTLNSKLAVMNTKYEEELSAAKKPEEKKLVEVKYKLNVIKEKRKMNEKRSKYLKKINQKMKPAKFKTV